MNKALSALAEVSLELVNARSQNLRSLKINVKGAPASVYSYLKAWGYKIGNFYGDTIQVTW